MVCAWYARGIRVVYAWYKEIVELSITRNRIVTLLLLTLVYKLAEKFSPNQSRTHTLLTHTHTHTHTYTHMHTRTGVITGRLGRCCLHWCWPHGRCEFSTSSVSMSSVTLRWPRGRCQSNTSSATSRCHPPSRQELWGGTHTHARQLGGHTGVGVGVGVSVGVGVGVGVGVLVYE